MCRPASPAEEFVSGNDGDGSLGISLRCGEVVSFLAKTENERCAIVDSSFSGNLCKLRGYAVLLDEKNVNTCAWSVGKRLPNPPSLLQ